MVTKLFAGHGLTDLLAEVLQVQGFTGVSQSPPGADRGIDILPGIGPLGMDAPRLTVQVKAEQVGVQSSASCAAPWPTSTPIKVS